MAIGNKAHTATANRIARRYGAQYNPDGDVDIRTDSMTIEVETTATLHEGLRRLAKCDGAVYIALTNKEGVQQALRLVDGTRVGVMNPQGDIVRESVFNGE